MSVKPDVTIVEPKFPTLEGGLEFLAKVKGIFGYQAYLGDDGYWHVTAFAETTKK